MGDARGGGLVSRESSVGESAVEEDKCAEDVTGVEETHASVSDTGDCKRTS